MGNCIKQICKKLFQAKMVHNIAGYKIRQVKVLAEGGYGYIWKVEDLNKKCYYALKKMICQTPESKKNFESEIEIIKFIGDHENIVRFLGVHRINKDSYQQGLILMELATKTLFDFLLQTQDKQLPQKEIIKLLIQICKGIKHMHDKQVTHRDIKVENILLFENNTPKLCDFGSASRKKIDLSKVSKNQLYAYEQIFQKNTTLMYRPPQMIDLYLQYQVNEKVDIWMLGCVVYIMNYYIHPFQQVGKLAIINANFKIPEGDRVSNKMKDLIRLMLTPDPSYRPDINKILNILQTWYEIETIELNEIAMTIKQNEKSMRQGNYQNYNIDIHKKQSSVIKKEKVNKEQSQGSWYQYQ